MSRTKLICIIYTTRIKGCHSSKVPEDCSSGEVENPFNTGHDIILVSNNVEAVVQPSNALPHSGLIHALETTRIREIQERLLKVLLQQLTRMVSHLQYTMTLMLTSLGCS